MGRAQSHTIYIPHCIASLEPPQGVGATLVPVSQVMMVHASLEGFVAFVYGKQHWLCVQQSLRAFPRREEHRGSKGDDRDL